jgi:hypothetical protein
MYLNEWRTTILKNVIATNSDKKIGIMLKIIVGGESGLEARTAADAAY